MQIGEIGKGIAARRKQAGLSQEELAQRLGLTRQAVSRWESGAALPTVDNLVELARVLDASVDDLLQLTREEKQAGLSAESVGLLLDEQAERQAKRMKRLSWILIAAAVALVLGIVLSAWLSNRRVRRLEESVNRQIGSLSTKVSQMSGHIGSEVAGAVENALAENRSELSDKGYRAMTYAPETQAVDIQVFAYPLKLEAQAEAQFSAVCSGGKKITVPAAQTDSGFEATLSIPVSADEDWFNADVYVVWTQDGQRLTEKVCSISRYMDEIRPSINAYWEYISNTETSDFKVSAIVRPAAEDLDKAYQYPNETQARLELSILYKGETMAQTALDDPGTWYREEGNGDGSASLPQADVSVEWNADELIKDVENVRARFVYTDWKGNVYTKEFGLEEQFNVG